MKFCPVVPEICRGQVHGPRKEKRRRRIKMSAIFKMAAKTRHKIWAIKIQHCPISSKFDMWVDNIIHLEVININVRNFTPFEPLKI
jgi:hypothetical protein